MERGARPPAPGGPGGSPVGPPPTKRGGRPGPRPGGPVRDWGWEEEGARRRYTGVCAVFTPEPLADGGFCAIVPAEGGVCGA